MKSFASYIYIFIIDLMYFSKALLIPFISI